MLDTGASHHVTRDLANLSLANDYHGDDQLIVANGKSLPITHSGSTHINTPTSPLHLTNVLYVPTISQILISVSQLCQTNHVSIEFFPCHFEVKDLSTGTILLCGRNEHNVYKLSSTSSQPQSHYVRCQTPLDIWHGHLGHPASRTLHHTLKNNKLSFSSPDIKCLDCLANKSHKLPFSKSTVSSSYPLEVIYSDV